MMNFGLSTLFHQVDGVWKRTPLPVDALLKTLEDAVHVHNLECGTQSVLTKRGRYVFIEPMEVQS